MNLYISVLGKLVFDFFVIREMCFYFRVIFEPTTFAGIIFHFFGDFSVNKARKLDGFSVFVNGYGSTGKDVDLSDGIVIMASLVTNLGT